MVVVNKSLIKGYTVENTPEEKQLTLEEIQNNVSIEMLKSINERSISIIAEKLGVPAERVVPESKLVDDLSADSLDLVELIMILEDEFDFSIPDEEAEKFTTVKDIIDYINGRLL